LITGIKLVIVTQNCNDCIAQSLQQLQWSLNQKTRKSKTATYTQNGVHSWSGMLLIG
jgi:hypothetical protein